MVSYRVSLEDLHAVLEMVAEGHHLLEVCNRLALPYSTVWRKLNDDPDLLDLYRRASEAFGDARAARVSEEIRSEPDPKRAAVIANYERWIIESKARRTFGKVTRHEHAGEVALNTRSEPELMAMLEQKLAALGISPADFAALIKRKGKGALIEHAPVADPQTQG